MSDAKLLNATLDLAAKAGVLIMRHYEAGLQGRWKADSSPVTDADEEAEHLILAGLRDIAPGVPVVSEEAAAGGHIPDVDDVFFLVDPLDGTKEFLARNGEFTVNIALVEKGVATLGIVYAPAFARMFWGSNGSHAYETLWPVTRAEGESLTSQGAQQIECRHEPDHLIALWSRSHDKHKAEEYQSLYNIGAVRTVGSSLKFCLIAAGEADIYPRHGTTMEWDTAAGQAVLEAAGGSVCDLRGQRHAYGKTQDGFKNGSFVARGRR